MYTCANCTVLACANNAPEKMPKNCPMRNASVMEAARAGYDPASGVTLWQKMMEASKGAPPQFLSTHPSSDTRIKEMQASLPKVDGLYQRAAKPARRFGPPAAG